jgi:hypothetical protein
VHRENLAQYLASKTYVEPEELYQVPRLPRPEGISVCPTPVRERRLTRLASSSKSSLSRLESVTTTRAVQGKYLQMQLGSMTNQQLSSVSHTPGAASLSKSRALVVYSDGGARISAASEKCLDTLRDGQGLSDMQWDGLVERCGECKQYFLSDALKVHIRRCLGQIIL